MVEEYVFPAFATCDSASITFDLWILQAWSDTFAMVVNFLDKNWVRQHVTVGLFEALRTLGAAFA